MDITIDSAWHDTDCGHDWIYPENRTEINADRDLYRNAHKGNEELPTEIGKTYRLDWRGDPPHMLPPDIPVWYRFLDRWKGEIEKLYYNCLLGGAWLSEEEERDPLKRMWRHNTAKRPDAIAETKDEVWIIEVSANPGLRAMGQCFSYQALWEEDPVIAKIDRAVLVCETLDTDLGAAAGKMGVRIFVI